LQREKPNETNIIGAITEISEAIISDYYLVEDILRLVVLVTAELMGSNTCSLMLLNEQTQELEIRATQSISDEYLQKAAPRMGEGIAGMVASTNLPVQVLDVREDPRYLNKEVASKENLCSLLCVPLSVRGKVIGVLNCYTSSSHRFSEHEINVLTTIANQSAIAIENSELMVRTHVISEELETRKSVDRAKDILIRDKHINGEDAFRRIQKTAMDTRKSIREIAEAIIMADMGE
jgi:signal transduction protein with GAF and PtsI domain